MTTGDSTAARSTRSATRKNGSAGSARTSVTSSTKSIRRARASSDGTGVGAARDTRAGAGTSRTTTTRVTRATTGNTRPAPSPADQSGVAGRSVRSTAANDRVEPVRSPAARRLLRAADELFFRQGAVATSIREITGACGLTPGALYNHFASKDELLFVLVEQRHRFLEDEVTNALSAARDNPADRLAAVVAVYIRVHVQGHKGSRVANREYRNLTQAHRAEVIASRRRLRDKVVSILLEGMGQGIFDVVGGADRPSVTVAAAAILDMCVHAGEWLHHSGALPMAEIENRYVTMALRLAGVRADANDVDH